MADTMRAQERALARKNLDKRLNSIRNSNDFARPPKGWIKAIREALGMTAEQLAKRIGVKTPRIYELEKSEPVGSMSMDSLQRAANALDCELVYALVPRKPLDDLVRERAQGLAKERLKKTSHSMALEDQSVDATDEAKQLNMLIKEIVGSTGSALWREE